MYTRCHNFPRLSQALCRQCSRLLSKDEDLAIHSLSGFALSAALVVIVVRLATGSAFGSEPESGCSLDYMQDGAGVVNDRKEAEE